MFTRKIKIYDIELGEVVYGRVDGKVMAMKTIGFNSCKDLNANIHTTYNFKCADGKNLDILMWKNIPLYRTIEDCINDVDRVEVMVIDYSYTLIENHGFVMCTHPIGVKELCADRWYWDGFQAKQIITSHCNWDLYVCEKGSSVKLNRFAVNTYAKYGKLYKSAEECKQDNVVQVVTF